MAESNIELLDGKDTFLTKISQAFKDDSFSDVTLLVGNRRYPAHKSILAVSSTYFQRMFYGDWKESKGDEVKLKETPDCKDVFEIFLKYFYSGTVRVSTETVIPVVTLADKYDVEGLKEICTLYMIDMLNTKGSIVAALGWLDYAEQMNMHDLLKKCYDLVCFNFEKASMLSGWTSLSPEQILVILKRSDVVVSKEYNVYLAVQKWLKRQEHGVTPEEVARILPYIQFKNMTVQDVCQVETSPLATNKVCKIGNVLNPYLFEAFRYMAIKSNFPEGDYTPAKLQRDYTCDTLSQ